MYGDWKNRSTVSKAQLIGMTPEGLKHKNKKNNTCDSNVFYEKIFRNLAENPVNHPVFA
jgi:hypothetical protein